MRISDWSSDVCSSDFSAAANGCWIGAINRVGTEAPWNIGEFYGQSYFVNPRGQIEKIASRDQDELIVHDLDRELIRILTITWQFFRDRRSEERTVGKGGVRKCNLIVSAFNY